MKNSDAHSPVLHLMGMTSTKYGGLEAYMVECTRQGSEMGFRTVLQYEEQPASQEYVRDIEREGGEIISLQLGIAGMWRTAKCVSALLCRYRPRALVLHFSAGNPDLPYIVPILGRLFFTPRVVRVLHGMHTPPLHGMRRWALSRYDHILCVSNAVVDGFGLSGYDGANVRTHYLGLLGDRERSRALRQSYRAEFGIPADSPVLATLAFDAPVKGVDVLLKAFADVCRQMAGCHLIIIGIEEERSALPGLAKDLGIAPNVHWAGIRDNGWQLLNAADVYVQPSRSEGLPFAMMEAMAMRLPVVGTRVGGIPEAVVDGVTGRVVPPEDPEALGCAIFDVLKNPHTWAALGDAGRGHYLEHFHGERSVKRILQSYCGLDPVTGIGNL